MIPSSENHKVNDLPAVVSKPLVNFIIEFGPIVIFFITFEIFSFMVSVGTLIITVIFSFVASIVVQKRLALFPLISSASVIIFGLLTLFLRNPDFIIFKDTLYFGFFGFGIVTSLLGKRLVLKQLFGELFAITDKTWRTISWRWGIFMLLLALSNEFARLYFSPTEWVRYKFIVLVIAFMFSTFQFITSSKGRIINESNRLGFRIKHV